MYWKSISRKSKKKGIVSAFSGTPLLLTGVLCSVPDGLTGPEVSDPDSMGEELLRTLTI